MGEIRIVGPGKTRRFPYPACKKNGVISPGAWEVVYAMLRFFFNDITN